MPRESTICYNIPYLEYWRSRLKLDKLKQVRRLKGVTQKELAERSGVSQPEISRSERGMEATPQDVALLSKVLGVEPEELAEPIGPVSINVNPDEVEPVMKLVNAYRQDPSVLTLVTDYLETTNPIDSLRRQQRSRDDAGI